MPEIHIPNSVIVGVQVFLAFGGAFVLALWVSLVVWTFRDIKARSRDIFAILLATLIVVVFGPLGIPLYFLLRPQDTLAELYERSLEEEALLQDIEERAMCPGCRRKVEPNWIVCPDCHTRLKKECPACGKHLHLRWNVCPYCGESVSMPLSPVEPEPLPEEPEPEPEEAIEDTMLYTEPSEYDEEAAYDLDSEAGQ